MIAPTEQNGYDDWVVSHRNDPDKFIEELELYLVRPESWLEIARYEYNCISKSHSVNLWSTWQPLMIESVWESFKNWLNNTVYGDTPHNEAAYISDRLFDAHSKLTCRQLLEIGSTGVAAFSKQSTMAPDPRGRVGTIQWIHLLATAKPENVEELNGKVKLVAELLQEVPFETLDSLVQYIIYDGNDVTPIAIATYLLPEFSQLFNTYDSLALSQQEIADVLRYNLVVATNEAMPLPDEPLL